MKNHTFSLKNIQNKSKYIKKTTVKWIKENPIVSFMGTLGLVIVFIIISNALNQTTSTQTPTQSPILVSVFSVGETPTYSANARVEKTNIITITSQVPGVVSHIYVNPGQNVNRYQSLVSLASNYNGGNPASVQRQLAARQLAYTNNTFDQQLEVIRKQRDIANLQNQNAEELNDIQEQSKQGLEDQLNLSRNIIAFIDQNLLDLEENNTNGSNDELINQTKQLKLQYQSTINQLEQTKTNLDYQLDENNPPQKLQDAQRRVAIAQLDLQEQSLTLQKEVQELQLKLARINEANYYPSSPGSAIVERVHVRLGQSVNPGSPLITLNLSAGITQIVASVPQSIAQSIRTLDAATINTGSDSFQATPDYVSTVQTEGNLYSVIFTLEEDANLIDGQFVTVELPLGLPDTFAANPTIPIDAVYQSSGTNYVFLAGEDNRAQSREVELGQVLGNTVVITSGLSNSDQVITNRNVVAGDLITRKTQ